LKRLYEEVAYVAYHFHWPHDQLMSLDHLERHHWVQQIAQINTRMNADDSPSPFDSDFRT
jgi:hypothetical protein